MSKNPLLYFAMKYDGDFYKIYNAITTKEPIDISDYNNQVKNVQYKYITAVDPRYPDMLKDKPNPPIVLFYEGNLDLLKTSLPFRYDISINDRRFLTTTFPTEMKDGKIKFDYLLMSESQNDLKFLLNHMKSKGIEFKDYSIYNKDRNRQR